MNHRLTPLVLLVGVVSIAFAAIFFKLAAPTHPLVAAGVRLVIASILLSPFTFRGLRNGNLSPKILKAAAIAGVLYALHFGLWVSSLSYTTVAASVTLVTATPLFLASIAVVTGTDKPTPRLGFALILATAGVVVIGGTDLGTSRLALFGDALALAGAFAIALYMLLVRSLGDIDIWSFAGVATGVGGGLLLSTAVATGTFAMPGEQALFWLFMAALIPQLVGHSAITWVLRHTTPTVVGISTLVEPVGSAALAFVIFNELPPQMVWVGCALTLTAVAIALTGRSVQKVGVPEGA